MVLFYSLFAYESNDKSEADEMTDILSIKFLINNILPQQVVLNAVIHDNYLCLAVTFAIFLMSESSRQQ